MDDIYRLLITASSESSFEIVLEISSEASALSLHEAIAETCGFPKDLFSSFVQINEDSQVIREVALGDLGFDGEVRPELMHEVTIWDLFDNRDNNRILYVYEPITEQSLVIDVVKFETREETLEKPKIILQKGVPPKLESFDDFNLDEFFDGEADLDDPIDEGELLDGLEHIPDEDSDYDC